MAKRTTSAYTTGRSGEWRKMKTEVGIERERGRLAQYISGGRVERPSIPYAILGAALRH